MFIFMTNKNENIYIYIWVYVCLYGHQSWKDTIQFYVQLFSATVGENQPETHIIRSIRHLIGTHQELLQTSAQKVTYSIRVLLL